MQEKAVWRIKALGLFDCKMAQAIGEKLLPVRIDENGEPIDDGQMDAGFAFLLERCRRFRANERRVGVAGVDARGLDLFALRSLV
jgi:hypothetical protein